MAHGLLQSPNENQEFKDFGNQYIDELYSRSFLEDYMDCGHVWRFKIHDLVAYHETPNAIEVLFISNCEKLDLTEREDNQ